MKRSDLPAGVLARRAVVYVRQSTTTQMEQNLESQRRQYELAELARSYGFRDVVVIDDDLGRSATGTTDRPGFRTLVAQICEGSVGAVFCLEASRLARNGREWHHLLELCGLVEAYVVDSDGIYDPGTPNDRLLLGLKGTMSEFELTLLRSRMKEGALSMARRGELRIAVPVGYEWKRDLGLMKDPDLRVQEAVRSVFRLFQRLGSARQVTLHMRREGLAFPSVPHGQRAELVWRAPVFDSILGMLKNPFYAGAYAYGKTGTRTRIENGMPRKSSGHSLARGEWTAFVRDHHEAYITWEQFEGNQEKLARNTYGKASGQSKSGRGGSALLSGLLRCRRCGWMLQVMCSGDGVARYVCRSRTSASIGTYCSGVGTRRPDEAVAKEVLLAVRSMDVEAALMAEAEIESGIDEKRRALELEHQQATFEVQLAARRYEAVDPENRLVATELEARWNAALEHLRNCEARLTEQIDPRPRRATRESLLALSTDLEGAWQAPTTTPRTKQRLLRTLIEEIVIDIDAARSEIQLIIHWHGGQHSELRIPKPRPGEHGNRTPIEAEQIIREMATRWPDEHIAATLNRMGLRTGCGDTWTKLRVQGVRQTAGIRKYASFVKDGRCLTMTEAAQQLGVAAHVVRTLIRRRILPARQVVPDAPWQIDAADLDRPEVREALRTRRGRRGRPCRNARDDRTLTIPGT